MKIKTDKCKKFSTKNTYGSLYYNILIIPFKCFFVSIKISLDTKPKSKPKLKLKLPSKPTKEYRRPDLASGRSNERLHETYPLQRMRVYAQKGKEGPELPEDRTIAYAYSRLDAWDWARNAGYGGMYEWASEWVLLNSNGTYVKTVYQEDYQRIK